MWRPESGLRPTASERERRTGGSWYVRPVQGGKVVEELMAVFIRIGRPQENLLGPALTEQVLGDRPSTTTPLSSTDVGSGESSTAISSVTDLLATNPRMNQVAVAYPTTTTITTHLPDSVSGLMSLLNGVVSRAGASSISGRIVQSSGFHNGYRLHLEVPLAEEEGDRLLASFLVDRAESPW